MAVEKKDPGAGRPLRGVPAAAARGAPGAPPRPPRRRPARPAPGSAGPAPACRAAGPRRARRSCRLVLWPALLTLAVTLLRLVGELRGWSPEYFSRLPGGGLSPLGITWLAPLVGFYFGWRLERAGVRSPSPAVALRPAGRRARRRLRSSPPSAGGCCKTVVDRQLRAVGGRLASSWRPPAFAAWPALGRRPAGLRVRGPHSRSSLVMAVAIWKGWGTHYDAAAPRLPGRCRRCGAGSGLGLLPQATIWVAWTMATGAIGGALGWRRPPAGRADAPRRGPGGGYNPANRRAAQPVGGVLALYSEIPTYHERLDAADRAAARARPPRPRADRRLGARPGRARLRLAGLRAGAVDR